MGNPVIQETVLPYLSAAGTLSIPTNAYILGIVIKNQSANAVTGGISIGTTLAGTDVVAAQAVGANAIVYVTDATLLKRIFSDIASTTLYVGAVAAWNSAVINVTVLYVQL